MIGRFGKTWVGSLAERSLLEASRQSLITIHHACVFCWTVNLSDRAPLTITAFKNYQSGFCSSNLYLAWASTSTLFPTRLFAPSSQGAAGLTYLTQPRPLPVQQVGRSRWPDNCASAAANRVASDVLFVFSYHRITQQSPLFRLLNVHDVV